MSIFKGGLEEDCPFCEKILNEDCDFTSDEIVAYFEPRNPVTEGHMIFVPTIHAMHRMKECVGSVSVEQVMYTAHKYATSREPDFNLITSCIEPLTTSNEHIHVHYIPRSYDDGVSSMFI